MLCRVRKLANVSVPFPGGYHNIAFRNMSHYAHNTRPNTCDAYFHIEDYDDDCTGVQLYKVQQLRATVVVALVLAFVTF
eukprot:COSAG01_NODE_10112_length_2248_cov_25.796184_1_plen_78_part_10